MFEIVPSINLDKLNTPSLPINKEVKSHSVRTLSKPTYQNLISEHIKVKG